MRALLVGLVALLPLAVGNHGNTVAERGGPALIIEGAGAGHGVGMGQYGAIGMARAGFSFRQILAHYYPGTTVVRLPRLPRLAIRLGAKVRRLPFERYVAGVVGAELGEGWPLAALEAQAVAARSYALAAGGGRRPLPAGAGFQAYSPLRGSGPAVRRAVEETAGEVLTYQGKVAVAFYCASSGGITEAVQDAFPGSRPLPWLQGVPDPYDFGPYHRWRYRLPLAVAKRRLAPYLKGRLKGIVVLRRGVSPRIVEALVEGSGGAVQVSGEQLAEALGLPSSWAYFSLSLGGRTIPEPDRSGWQPPGGERQAASGGTAAPSRTAARSGR